MRCVTCIEQDASVQNGLQPVNVVDADALHIVFDYSPICADVDGTLYGPSLSRQKVDVEAGVGAGRNDFLCEERAVEVVRAAGYGLEAQVVLAKIRDDDGSLSGDADL